MRERIRGVNLSGWFIPEPWVTPSLFAATGASNEIELQAALGSVTYTERVRRHYETFIGEYDFRRIAAIGLDAVRLLVPWYAFGAQAVSEKFVPVVDYIDRAMEWAHKYHLGVLIDLATVPGGQGNSSSSPSTPESSADWHSSTNGRHIVLDALERLAKRYGTSESLLGLELLDAPTMSVRAGILKRTDGIPSHYLRNFYRDAYELVHPHLAADKLIVFSDSGHPSAWRHFMNAPRYRNMCMDLHLFHYTDETAQDITSPRGLSRSIARNRRQIAAARQSGFPVIIGAWSGAAVFAAASLTPEGRSAFERVFIANQLASFSQTAGWFFQTWKTEKRLDAWDARIALGTLERAMLV
ncbi:glucan 1,3-beta-glucosidase [Coriobacterium glomerans PW2]|uniref:Glucan 1,3-beta-glucosidase n=1 Tax=Coriobacterium glomerans (strain ATCC 49209 / DSM 20642 / JCM 10262 / PW2) TaxID=700015 RepID=F2NA77_CORGP|nr:hypothetical protein [Coriobacterium glomerans]AEB06471.1 glucan 1,3-beta-glucosidase [Coriobacterium glomerans PW2]